MRPSVADVVGSAIHPEQGAGTVTRFIEIRATKCLLLVTETELVRLFRDHPDIWFRAVRRGKHRLRAEKDAGRQAKARREGSIYDLK